MTITKVLEKVKDLCVNDYCQKIIHEYIDRLYEFRNHVGEILKTD